MPAPRLDVSSRKIAIHYIKLAEGALSNEFHQFAGFSEIRGGTGRWRAAA